MAKLSFEDKIRIQTLREQGMGAKLIKRAYPNKHWSLTTIKRICRLVDATGTALQRKQVTGRPKSARSEYNINKVQEMICSQEDHPGTCKSTRQIARELDIDASSVRRIAKVDLGLSPFRRTSVQVISEATKVKRLKRSLSLLQRLPFNKIKRVFHKREDLLYQFIS